MPPAVCGTDRPNQRNYGCSDRLAKSLAGSIPAPATRPPDASAVKPAFFSVISRTPEMQLSLSLLDTDGLTPHVRGASNAAMPGVLPDSATGFVAVGDRVGPLSRADKGHGPLRLGPI